VRTFYNMLGPIVNPIKIKKSLLGVFNLKMARMYHYYYQQKELEYSVVYSLDGYDEISLTGDFKVITPQGEAIYNPQKVNLPICKDQDLFGGSTADEAATIFNNVIENKATSAQKNVVIINTAFAIQTSCREKSLEECISEATTAIDSGAMKQTFKKFIALNS